MMVGLRGGMGRGGVMSTMKPLAHVDDEADLRIP
jgi:hypothetical protein